MNIFKRKSLFVAVLVVALVGLAGCATNKPDANYAAYLAAHQATEASKAQRPLFILEGIEGQQIELKGIKRLAVFMPDSAGGNGVAMPPQPARPWYGDLARDIIGGVVAFKTGQVMWNTVGALGSSIERAGTHGYQYVQAPGAVTTTTTTNTSTVNTTNSNNTTRNCTGGNGAAGGTATGTTGAPTAGQGGSAGSANC